MSKFLIVKEKPADLNKGEYLIDKPSFVTEIALHKAKSPKDGLTGPYYLRMIMDSIAQAYDPEGLTAFSIKAHNYTGRPFKSDEDMNEIMVEALKANCPAIFPKYLEVKVRARPAGTLKVIYVDSDIPGQDEIFYKNGLNEEGKEYVEKKKYDKVTGKLLTPKE